MFEGPASGHCIKYFPSKTDDISQQWPPLAVESSFSYLANSDNADTKYTRRMSGPPQQNEGSKSSTNSQNETLNFRIGNGDVSDNHNKSLPCPRGKGQDLKKNKDFLLLGRRLELSPEFWSPEYLLRRRSTSEPVSKSFESNEIFRHTYPPFNETNCTPSVSHPSTRNFGHSHDSSNFSNRHRHPAFNVRPLGQSSMKPSDQLQSRGGDIRKPRDDILACGVKQTLLTRPRGRPHRYTPSPTLERVSSQDSLGKYIPRSRSSSLPVPNKLHEFRVMMERKEQGNSGITYVTPFLQTLSDGEDFLHKERTSHSTEEH